MAALRDGLRGDGRVRDGGLIAAAFSLFFALAMPAATAQVPPQAEQYRRELTRQARLVWGLNAPIATFGAQIDQESKFDPDARSPVGALGIAQFMPATASWISGAYPALGTAAPKNPTWALRALAQYDKYLWDRVSAADECHRAAKMLSGYNGGLGNEFKDEKLCTSAACVVPTSNPGDQRDTPLLDKLRILIARLGLGGQEGADRIAMWATGTLPVAFRNFGARLFGMMFPEEVIGGAEATVLPVVLPNGHNSQVSRQEVQTIPVDVVDDDPSRKRLAGAHLGDQPMDVARASINRNGRISVQEENAFVGGYSKVPQNRSEFRGEIGEGQAAFLMAQAACGCNPSLWWGNVEKYSARDPSAFNENRAYAVQILLIREPRYVAAGWGRGVCEV